MRNTNEKHLRFFCWLFVAIQLISLHSVAAPESNSLLALQSRSDQSSFYTAQGRTLVISGLRPVSALFGDLNKERSLESRIVKVPTSFLERVGLREGATVHVADVLGSGRVTKYVFKKEFYALLRPRDAHADDENGTENWNKFNVVLSDSGKEISEILRSHSELVTGFGVAVTSLEITALSQIQSKLQRIQVNELPKAFRGKFSKQYDSGWSQGTLGGKRLLALNVDSSQRKVQDVFIEASAGSFYKLGETLNLVTDDGLHIKSWSLAKGHRVLFFKNLSAGFDCFDLVLIKSHHIEKVELPCRRE